MAVRSVVAIAVLAASLSGVALLAAGQRSEKESRTPAQRKIDSHLLFEIYKRKGQAEEKQVPPGPTGVKVDAKDRALVDLRAAVTPELEKTLRDMDAVIVTTSREYRSIVAWVPLLKLEQLAGDETVTAIVPAAEARTGRQEN